MQNHSEWKGTVSLSTTNPEIKAGARGSSMGIDALTMAAISKGSSFFLEHHLGYCQRSKPYFGTSQ